MKLVVIIGARPQFIKHYPFEQAASKLFEIKTIHTGQHYDKNMSEVFFDQLGMERPAYMLTLGGGSHGEQTGKMLIEIERILLDELPDGVVVYGDTNSTLAGALAAAKLHVPVFHIEAGLRSYNKRMPEEINRVTTDHVSTMLFVPSQRSVDNLQREGILQGVHIVGDIMKDLILSSIDAGVLKKPDSVDSYIYVTLHRPYNVDRADRLRYVMKSLGEIDTDLVFAIHPRTRQKIENFGINIPNNLHLIDPQPYFENLSYLAHSYGLITDSGGMQKEAYWLQKPCTTVRSETEWTETLAGRANRLVFEDLSSLGEITSRVANFDPRLYGDGASADRISTLIKESIA